MPTTFGMGGRVPAPDGCLQARDRDAGSALTVRRERVSGHRRHRERKQQMENWRPRVSALIVGAAAIVLLPSVPTSARAAADTTPLGHACAPVMGLAPSEEPYEDCVGSLDKPSPRLKRWAPAA